MSPPACKIRFPADMHPTKILRGTEGDLIDGAEYDLKDNYRYVRAVVIDEQGKYAWTNPISID